MTTKRMSVPWTEREDALICRLRNKDCDYDEIAAKLPHRTPIAVKRRVAHLITAGRIASLRAPWTEEEDALICKLREKSTSLAEIARHFKTRTADAIAQRIQQLRLDGRVADVRARSARRRPWTDQEEGLIVVMRARGAKLDEIAAELPHRTRGAVAARVQELLEVDELERTPHSPQSHQPWSFEEDELVTVMRRAGKALEEMATALGRSQASVNSRIAQRLRKGELGRVKTSQKRENNPLRRSSE